MVTDGACVAYSTSKLIALNPSILLTNPLASLSTCKNIASVSTNFDIIGYNLTTSVTITAPSNFEIASILDGAYSSNLTLTNTSTISQTIYVRLSASATTGLITGTIAASSAEATDVSITLSGTVNLLPTISIVGNQTNVDLVSVTASGGSSYDWSDGSSKSTATNTFDASGLYSLSVTDANG